MEKCEFNNKYLESCLKKRDSLIQSEDYSCLFEWAQNYFDENNLPLDFKLKVIEAYDMCLKQGNSEAAISLGALYYNGLFVERNFEKAASYYQTAADMGNEMGICNLGYCYYYGRHGEVDYAKAYELFSLGVLLFDNAICLYKLGDMFLNGYHVEKNEKRAYRLFIRSLYQMSDYQEEFADINLRVGRCKLRGIGTELDYEGALSYLCKALVGFYERRETDPFVPGLIESCKELIEECESNLSIRMLID